MNMLNSLIIEGTIKNNYDGATLDVVTERNYRAASGETAVEESLFPVYVYGNMIEVVKEKGTVGRGIRIVGRLKQIKYTEDDRKQSKLVVIAEHIEFKPMTVKTA